jgi:hypothetical protein
MSERDEAIAFNLGVFSFRIILLFGEKGFVVFLG